MKTMGLLALAAIAGTSASALASVSAFTPVASVTFTNKNSVDAQGDPDNARDSWISPVGGSVTAIRVTGSLTEVNTATFASEARVRLSAGAGSSFTAFNYQASTVGNYTGTLAIGPTTIGVPAFSLSAGGQVNFEWFESFQDDANLPESRWDTVTYELGANVITNGNFNLGTIPQNGTTQVIAGSHVAGGLDFFTFSLGGPVANIGDYLNIKMKFGATGGMTDTEIALYDGNGNLVATDDDGFTGFASMLTFGASDPLAGAGGDVSLPGANGLSLAAGNYTLVTGGFNTVFGATIGQITPGTNAGTYSLEITSVPTPGALALLGVGGLLAGRRRR
ncbi:MAG: hypothetical protein SFY69_06265 [Planctomycetota bacterium]|nr:hypothetical protein [Planctomycetota bacterium]